MFIVMTTRERAHNTMDGPSVLDTEATCTSTAPKVHVRCACSGRNRDLRKRDVLGGKKGAPVEELRAVKLEG